MYLHRNPFTLMRALDGRKIIWKSTLSGNSSGVKLIFILIKIKHHLLFKFDTFFHHHHRYGKEEVTSSCAHNNSVCE